MNQQRQPQVLKGTEWKSRDELERSKFNSQDIGICLEGSLACIIRCYTAREVSDICAILICTGKMSKWLTAKSKRHVRVECSNINNSAFWVNKQGRKCLHHTHHWKDVCFEGFLDFTKFQLYGSNSVGFARLNFFSRLILSLSCLWKATMTCWNFQMAFHLLRPALFTNMSNPPPVRSSTVFLISAMFSEDKTSRARVSIPRASRSLISSFMRAVAKTRIPVENGMRECLATKGCGILKLFYVPLEWNSRASAFPIPPGEHLDWIICQ